MVTTLEVTAGALDVTRVVLVIGTGCGPIEHQQVELDGPPVVAQGERPERDADLGAIDRREKARAVTVEVVAVENSLAERSIRGRDDDRRVILNWSARGR